MQPLSSLRLAIAVAALTGATACQCATEWVSTSAFPGVQGVVLTSIAWDVDGPGPAPELLVVGGDFGYAGDQIVRNLASFDPVTGDWSSFAGGTDGDVETIVQLPDGSLAIGGAFTEAGGTARDFLGRWDGTSWSSIGGGADSVILDLAVAPGGDLIACGRFDNIGGVAANHVARWDGSTWSALGAGLSPWIYSVATLANGDLAACGTFFSAGGQPAAGLARFDGTSWQPFGIGVSGTGRKLRSMPNGDLILAGSFSGVDLVPAFGIARWDGSTWGPLGAGLTNTNGLANVWGLDLAPNGDLIVGGSFEFAGGVAAESVASWDGATWTPVGSQLDGTVRSLATDAQGQLYAMGSVSTAPTQGGVGQG